MQLEGEPVGPSASTRDRPGRDRPVSALFQAGFSAPAYRAGIPGPGDHKEISQKRGDNLCHVSGGRWRPRPWPRRRPAAAARRRGPRRPGPRGHPGRGHTTTGFTAVPAAQAPGGIGPKFQCGDTCDPNGGGNPPPPPPTITCTISTVTPWQGLSGALISHADTVCTGNVAQIAMSENVIHPPDAPRSDVDIRELALRPTTSSVAACSPGQWHTAASAYITPPAGWVIITESNPIVATSPTITFSCGGGGGGGGGGCATATPSVPAQPAARQPDVISCP